MQWVSREKIELDAPVVKYLPWFRVADERSGAAITVRQLLQQTSDPSTRTGREQGFGQTLRTTRLEPLGMHSFCSV